jgi:hypothetical protein
MVAAVLKLVPRPANQSIVTALKKHLEDAEDGDLVGLSGVAVYGDGRVGYYFMGECARKPFTTREYLATLRDKILQP